MIVLILTSTHPSTLSQPRCFNGDASNAPEAHCERGRSERRTERAQELLDEPRGPHQRLDHRGGDLQLLRGEPLRSSVVDPP